MTRVPVSSSSIAAIGHDGDALEVEFTSGSVYRYTGVPRSVFDDLLGASSVGQHFQEHVRGGGFPHTRVDDAQQERS